MIIEWGVYNQALGGNNTFNRIFLLSVDEILRYFGDNSMMTTGKTMGIHNWFSVSRMGKTSESKNTPCFVVKYRAY